MATPKVSAVAALLVDKYGKMSPTKLKQLLLKNAVDPVKGKDKAYFGNGFLMKKRHNLTLSELCLFLCKKLFKYR